MFLQKSKTFHKHKLKKKVIDNETDTMRLVTFYGCIRILSVIFVLYFECTEKTRWRHSESIHQLKLVFLISSMWPKVIQPQCRKSLLFFHRFYCPNHAVLWLQQRFTLLTVNKVIRQCVIGSLFFRVWKHHSENGHRQNGHNGVRADRHPANVGVPVERRRSVGVVRSRNIHQVILII